MILRPKHLLIVVVLAAALAGCKDRLGKPDMSGAPSFYCMGLGYTYEVREDSEGNKFEVCIFPDGYECEVEAFLTGECGLNYTYCARQGMAASQRQSEDGKISYVICRFPDGSYCLDFDFAFYQDKCAQTRRAITCDVMPGGLCPATPVPGE